MKEKGTKEMNEEAARVGDVLNSTVGVKNSGLGCFKNQKIVAPSW